MEACRYNGVDASNHRFNLSRRASGSALSNKNRVNVNNCCVNTLQRLRHDPCGFVGARCFPVLGLRMDEQATDYRDVCDIGEETRINPARAVTISRQEDVEPRPSFGDAWNRDTDSDSNRRVREPRRYGSRSGRLPQIGPQTKKMCV